MARRMSSSAAGGKVSRIFRQGGKVIVWGADTLSNRVAFINQGSILTIDTPERLKLLHGRRSVRVRTRHGDGVDEQVIPLDEAGSGDLIREAVSNEGFMTIHTEEATLEDIFVEYAGRGLA